MLSISAVRSGQEHYYQGLAREDYYLEGGEPPGRWIGEGAKALGLSSHVESADLSSLLAGEDPGGKSLGQVQRYSDGRSHAPGWDLTFSAPKSVSTLWSQGDSKLRKAIESAHDAAVTAALSYLETDAARGRRGKGGERLENVSLVIATFEHGTSRAQDPQLHTHSLVANTGLRQDGTWGAINSRDLYIHKMAAGALYRAELAHQLRLKLGLALEAVETWFEVSGIPPKLIEAFSSRRAQILEAAAEHGSHHPKVLELLALATREVKGHVARDELFERWGKQGFDLGFGRDEVRALLGQATITRSPAQEARLVKDAARAAVAEILKQDSTFDKKDLVRDVAERLQAKGVSAKAIQDGVTSMLEQGIEVVRNGEREGFVRYTTPENAALERDLLECADASRLDNSHVVDVTAVELAQNARPTMNEEQMKALAHITMKTGSIQCISGVAGSGKTFLLDAAREAWESQGLRVHGCAVAGRAARGLKTGAGIESQTIASLLYGLSWLEAVKHHAEQVVRAAKKLPTWQRSAWKPDARTVLVVDEAGMVGTVDMERLIRAVLGAGGKLVLVGDSRQLQPIDAGGPFDALMKLLGAAELKTIVRQAKEWMRDAVHEFAAGDAKTALGRYVEAGRVFVSETRDDARKALIEKWGTERTADLSETLILSGTRDDTRQLNLLAQAERIRRGELDPEHSVCAGETTFHLGERVVFLKNDRGREVCNGDFGTIEAIQKRAGKLPLVTIRVDESHKWSQNGKPVRFLVTFTPDTAIDLGYAVTTHKAQGATIDRCFVLAGGWMQDRELTYVQMSRMRHEGFVFGAEADIGEDQVELIRAMERSRQKELALHEELRKRENEMLMASKSTLTLHP